MVPSWSTRQVVIATLFVLGVLFISYLLYSFSGIVFIFIVAILLGTAIRPAVNWLNRRGLSPQAGVIVVYFLLFSLVVGLVFLLLPLLTGQIEAIAVDLPVYYQTIRDSLFNSPSRIMHEIALRMPASLQLITINAEPASEDTINTVVQSMAYVNAVTRGIWIMIAVFVLGFYWTLESERSIRSLLLWIPMNQRENVRSLITEIEEKVGDFIIGQGTLCLVIGFLALVAYLIIGLPYVLLLAVFAGIMEAVPIIGPTLGAIPAVLVAFSVDPTKAMWVIVATLIIQTLENYLLVPRIMKRSVGVNPFVTLLALTAFTSLLGVAGAVLAIPLAAIIQLVINRYLIAPAQSEVPITDGRDQLSRLSYESRLLAMQVRKQLRENENFDRADHQIVDSLESIANELAETLEEAQRAQVVE